MFTHRFRRASVVRALCLLSLVGGVWLLSGDLLASQAAKTKGFFWKATSPTTEAYFLGSIHVATADIYPLPQEIETAFKNASVLVVELDPTTIDQGQMILAMQKGMYPAGDSLEKHVSPATMTLLREFMKKNDVPDQMYAVFNQMKAGLASTALTVMVMGKLGMSADLGVDRHFLDMAHKSDGPAGTATKRIVELETADEQLSLLFGMDDTVADFSLKSSLEDTTKDQLDKLFGAWKHGDIATVESMVLESARDESSRKFMEQLVGVRNDVMTKKIAELLKGKERVFVVVGAAHLIGDRGIVKQLEKQGLKVERPDVTPTSK